MAFRRMLASPLAPDSDALTRAMVGIGMNFAAPATVDTNIEDTLVFASLEAMERDDLRVLTVLVQWFSVHAARVNADRLTHLATAQPSQRVRALWTALARSRGDDRRFARLSKLHESPRVDVLRTGSDFQLKRHGEDPRFANGPLRIAVNVLRERASDVLTPAELAARHSAYRWRVTIGPSYRADMWAALKRDPNLSAAALARATYGSFATAWQVRRDFAIVRQIATAAPRRC